MFTHTAKKLFVTLAVFSAIAIFARGAAAQESQSVTKTAAEQAREVHNRASQDADNISREVRRDVDNARDSLNRSYDNARDSLNRSYDNTRDSLNRSYDSTRDSLERGYDKALDGADRTYNEYREDHAAERRADVRTERLQYDNIQNMDVIKDTMPRMNYRGNLTASEREDIAKAEKRYAENIGEYNKKQTELRNELSRAEPGSREAKRLEEKIWDVERKISREQVDFREKMGKFE